MGTLEKMAKVFVCPKYDPICEAWHGFGEFIALPKDWFPELKYFDKPIAVELSIKKIEL